MLDQDILKMPVIGPVGPVDKANGSDEYATDGRAAKVDAEGEQQVYEFEHSFKDEYGNIQSRHESGNSDGSKVGSFSFILSDGRSRTVSYYANDQGFFPQIKSEHEGLLPYVPPSQISRESKRADEVQSKKRARNSIDPVRDLLMNSRTPVSIGNSSEDAQDEPTEFLDDNVKNTTSDNSQLLDYEAHRVVQELLQIHGPDDVMKVVEPKALETDKIIQQLVRVEVNRVYVEEVIEEEIQRTISNYLNENLTQLIRGQIKRDLQLYGLLDLENSTKYAEGISNGTIDLALEVNKTLVDDMGEANTSSTQKIRESIAVEQRTGLIEEKSAKNVSTFKNA